MKLHSQTTICKLIESNMQSNFLRRSLFNALVASLILPFWFSSASALTMGKLTLGADTFFENNHSAISLVDAEKLQALVQRMERHQIEVVVVIGYADTAEKATQRLSEERAVNVAKYLASLGVPPGGIFAEGKADKDPIDTVASRSRNRRAEIEYVGIPGRDVPTAGFNLMQEWGKPSNRDAYDLLANAFDGLQPLAQLGKIEDAQVRRTFAHKLVLYSIFTRDESVMAVAASKLDKCDADAMGLPNPYLLALVWGSVNDQRLLKKCEPTDATDRQQREKMFRHAFCSTHQSNPESWSKSAQNLFGEKKFLESTSADMSADLFTCLMDEHRTKWLIDNGASVVAKGADGKSALLYAVTWSQIKSAQLLLEAGADAKMRDSAGRTLLHLVKRQEYGGFGFGRTLSKIFQNNLWAMLVAHGADTSVKDNQGRLAVEP